MLKSWLSVIHPAESKIPMKVKSQEHQELITKRWEEERPGIINGRRPVIGSYYHHAHSALSSGVCHFVATPPSRSIIHHVTMSGDEEQNVPSVVVSWDYAVSTIAYCWGTGRALRALSTMRTSSALIHLFGHYAVHMVEQWMDGIARKWQMTLTGLLTTTFQCLSLV